MPAIGSQATSHDPNRPFPTVLTSRTRRRLDNAHRGQQPVQVHRLRASHHVHRCQLPARLGRTTKVSVSGHHRVRRLRRHVLHRPSWRAGMGRTLSGRAPLSQPRSRTGQLARRTGLRPSPRGVAAPRRSHPTDPWWMKLQEWTPATLPDPAVSPMAGRRDASWFDHPGTSWRAHIAVVSDHVEVAGATRWITPACNTRKAILAEFTLEPASNFAPYSRCQRHGCRERWPA